MREPTAPERAAIAEIFEGYEPDHIMVIDDYISDGPGYMGWVAVTLGGEPEYCNSFTKDRDGNIELCSIYGDNPAVVQGANQ